MFNILLILILIRPFISSLAFPGLNLIYSALFLIFLIFWVSLRSLPLNKIHSLKYPLLLFLLALAISTVFSTNRDRSLMELYKYTSGLLWFLIIACLDENKKVKIIHTLVLSGVIISILGIYQYLFGLKHLSDYITEQKIFSKFIFDFLSQRRIFSPFITPNILAGYLAMIFPLVLIYKKRIIYVIPLCLALLLTKSLGALLSLFLAMLIYSHLKGKIEKGRIIILTGLIIVMGTIFITRRDAPKVYLLPLFSTMMRLNYWKDTLKIIQDNLFTGVGLGNFILTYSRYGQRSLYAHNSYLQIWAEMGILGIISFLWLVIAVFKSALKNIKESANKQQIFSLITASSVFLIHNLVDFSFFLPEVSLIWWIILFLLFPDKNNLGETFN